MPPRDLQIVPVRSRASPRQRPRWLRWSILVLGWLLLLLGALGFLLPVIGGWLPFGLGLLLLSREQDWARRLVGMLRRRLPRLAAALDGAETRALGFMSRVGDWIRARRTQTKS